MTLSAPANNYLFSRLIRLRKLSFSRARSNCLVRITCYSSTYYYLEDSWLTAKRLNFSRSRSPDRLCVVPILALRGRGVPIILDKIALLQSLSLSLAHDR